MTRELILFLSLWSVVNSRTTCYLDIMGKPVCIDRTGNHIPMKIMDEVAAIPLQTNQVQNVISSPMSIMQTPVPVIPPTLQLTPSLMSHQLPVQPDILQMLGAQPIQAQASLLSQIQPQIQLIPSPPSIELVEEHYVIPPVQNEVVIAPALQQAAMSSSLLQAASSPIIQLPPEPATVIFPSPSVNTVPTFLVESAPVIEPIQIAANQHLQPVITHTISPTLSAATVGLHTQQSISPGKLSPFGISRIGVASSTSATGSRLKYTEKANLKYTKIEAKKK